MEHKVIEEAYLRTRYGTGLCMKVQICDNGNGEIYMLQDIYLEDSGGNRASFHLVSDDPLQPSDLRKWADQIDSAIKGAKKKVS